MVREQDKKPEESAQPAAHPARKAWAPIRILALLVVTGLVFGLGVAVGRGKVHVRGLSENPSVVDQIDYSSVNQVYSLLKKDFDGNLDQNQVLDGLKSGLVSATKDPYTEFFNPQAAKDLDNELAGSFSGIGAELGSDENNNIVIVSPLSGYPAEKAGLKPKDVVAAVNGQSTAGLSVSSVVQKIRGPVNTKVTLTIVRGGGNPFDVPITRQQITVPSVENKIDGSIGYLKISQFTNDTVKLAQAAATDFKSKGVKAVVLDLRGNPGGYLSGSVDISSLWLDQGKTVVSERRGNTIISTEYATGNDPLHGLPTVVLIDAGSASASEITAGALHDNGVATLVGAKSFGKGSVQTVEKLGDGSELKVTIARWYTPKGSNIDKKGITPDVSVSLSDDDKKAGRDPQKDKAYQILQAKL